MIFLYCFMLQSYDVSSKRPNLSFIFSKMPFSTMKITILFNNHSEYLLSTSITHILVKLR